MSFNPQKHLTKVKGRDYLEVKWRLVWFREEHPDYTIDTDFLILDMDQGVAVCQATISDKNNRQLAKGTKTEYKASFFDFVEKAETGAIGRALATLGYGTQFAPEMEEGERIVDSPVKFNEPRQKIINEINQIMTKGDLNRKKAQEILTKHLDKDSLKDCSLEELNEYLKILKEKNEK